MRSRARSLRKRVFLIGSATLVALLMMVYLFSAAITLTSFSRLERTFAGRAADEQRTRIQQEARELSNAAATWLRAHVKNDENLRRGARPFSGVTSLDGDCPADFVGMFSGGGKLVGAGNVDASNGGAGDSLEKNLAACGETIAAFETKASADDSSFGVLWIGARPAYVSLHRAEAGVFLFGRWLNATKACRFGTYAEWQALLTEISTPEARGSDSAVVVRKLDDRTVAASFSVVDPLGRRAGMATIEHARDMYLCAQQCLTVLMCGLALVGLLIGYLLRNVLLEVIFSRLHRLTAGVTKIRSTGDWSLTLAEEGDDDLAELASSINGLVGRLAAAEGDLRDSRQRAEIANEAKGRFLANMSHEIRTPLNGILGFAKLLDTGGDSVSAEERREWAHTICTCSEHLLALINDVLDFSKIEAGRMDLERIRCPIRSLLTETLNVMRPQADEKQLKLEIRGLDSLPPTIISDPTRLRQVITNLLSNAIKFTDRGSIKVMCECSPDWLCIRITDSGCGIPPEQLDAIFDPFVQADNSVTRKFGGTGLGLAISRQIARGLSGDLTVSSEPGKGSTFMLRLPLVVEKSGARPLVDATKRTAPAASGPAVPVQLSGRVLLVEDGETNRKLIELVLRRAGLMVECAENGRVGVEMASRSQYDVILMDMQMPVMDGYAAAQTLRRQGLTAPIIALTAHALGGDQARCASAGCTGYLSKPVDPDVLLKTLAQALPSPGIAPQASNACGKQSEPVPALPAPGILPPTAQHSLETAGGALNCSLPLSDPEFREIALEFVERLQEKLACMDAALQSQDLKELGRLAHWLKGAGGTAGFKSFTAPAAELETLAREAELAGLQEALQAIHELAQRIQIPECAAP